MLWYYLYIVLCGDGSYYTGITNDFTRRIYEHNHKNDPFSYTNKRKPVILLYYEVYVSPMEAIRREKQIKGWGRAKKEALINGNVNRLKSLSKKAFISR